MEEEITQTCPQWAYCSLGRKANYLLAIFSHMSIKVLRDLLLYKAHTFINKDPEMGASQHTWYWGAHGSGHGAPSLLKQVQRWWEFQLGSPGNRCQDEDLSSLSAR